MQEIKTELNTAWKALATIPVKDDAVDTLAYVRARLRRAYALIEAKEKEEVGNGG